MPRPTPLSGVSAEHIQRLVDQAPPLAPWQIDQLTVLLAPVRSHIAAGQQRSDDEATTDTPPAA
ncbi:hypothetical protein ACQEVC_45710 [Plantactinospora sp. CA-294935]|uniref:hypothetical protein n=1 Tax=Plantactinospora sp. CA-294935 TaxID=3240012 RepID=UPI003D8E27CE